MTNPITISEAACCAHIHVRYERVHYSQGTCSDSWVCSDCGLHFAPLTPALAELKRLNALHYDQRNEALADANEKNAICIEQARQLAELRVQLDAAREALLLARNTLQNCDDINSPYTDKEIDKALQQLTKENK